MSENTEEVLDQIKKFYSENDKTINSVAAGLVASYAARQLAGDKSNNLLAESIIGVGTAVFFNSLFTSKSRVSQDQDQSESPTSIN